MSLGEIIADSWIVYGPVVIGSLVTAYSALSDIKATEFPSMRTKISATATTAISILILLSQVNGAPSQESNTNQNSAPVEQLDDKAASLYPGNEANDVYYLRD